MSLVCGVAGSSTTESRLLMTSRQVMWLDKCPHVCIGFQVQVMSSSIGIEFSDTMYPFSIKAANSVCMM